MRSLSVSRLLTTLTLIILTAALLTIAPLRHAPHVAAQSSPACIAAPTGLVNWWPGDGHAFDIQDSSHGTLQNGATYAAGKVGQAFSFDGVNDFVSIANTAAMDFGTGDFAIDLWINFNSLSSLQTIVHKVVGTVPNDRAYFMEFNTPNALRFMVRDTSANQNDMIVPTTLVTGQWYHVAAVRTGNTSLLYLDGNLIGSKTAGSNVNTGSGGTARIGNTAPNGSGVSRPVSGRIDEVELFNRALSQSEIQAIVSTGSAGKCKPDADGDGVIDAFDACPGTPAGTAVNQSGCTVGACFAPPSSMVSWWPGDGNANDIKDGNSGTLINGATFASGMVGQAFSLDGVNDYVEVPDSPSLTPSSITLDAWVKPNSLSGERLIVSKYNSNNPSQGTSWLLGTIPGTGRLRFWAIQDASATIRRVIETNSSVLTVGVWHHIAATFNIATQAIKIYVNGVEVPSTLSGSTTITSIYDSNTPVRIGVNVNAAGSFGNFWDGLIDEVEIFNSALTFLEIQAIYNAGSAGKCKNNAPGAACQNVNVSAGASKLHG